MVDHQKPPEDKDIELNRIFAALAASTRRRIITLLREAGELKVTDIAQTFSMSLNGVSKHLKVLERAGLILRRIQGREHWLSVNAAQLQIAQDWLHVHRHFWRTRLDRLVEVVQEKTPETKGKP